MQAVCCRSQSCRLEVRYATCNSWLEEEIEPVDMNMDLYLNRSIMERYISQETLRRLEEGDALMRMIRMSRTFDLDDIDNNQRSETRAKHSEVASFSPKSTNDVTRLGKALAKPGRPVTGLEINGINGFDEMIGSNDVFLKGLNLNDSITTLKLMQCTSEEGAIALIRSFEGREYGLHKISIEHCNLGDVGIRALSQSLPKLGGSVGLQRIHLNNIDMSVPHLDMLVSAITRDPGKIEDFMLATCSIANSAPLASLLESPNCKLKMLRLYDNLIDNDGAMVLIKALTKNDTLTHLYLNNQLDEYALNSFSQALCNTSCPNATYSSNHTLSYVMLGQFEPSGNIQRLSKLNRTYAGPSKRKVPMKKILQTYAHIDMTPFFEYDMKLLPYVIGWFETASSSIDRSNEDVNIEHRKLNALYEFIREKPLAVTKVPSWESSWDRGTRCINATWAGQLIMGLLGGFRSRTLLRGVPFLCVAVVIQAYRHYSNEN